MAIQFKKTGSHKGLHLYKADNIDLWFLSGALDEALTLAKSWELSGMYIFAAAKPVAGASEKPAAELLAETSNQLLEKASKLWLSHGITLRVLWVENVSDPFNAWCYNALLLDKEKRISGQWGFRWSGYRLEFYRGMTVKCEADSFIVGGADGCESFGALQTQGLRLACESKAVINLGEKTGAPAGSLNFTAHGKESSAKNIFQLLDVGMYYSEGSGGDDDADRESGYLNTLYSPVLSYQKEITLTCTLHPSYILCKDYTFFSLPIALKPETYLVNPMGECLKLECTDSSCLVFQERPFYLYGGIREQAKPKKRYYLSLMGKFSIIKPAKRKKVELMCGLTGTEAVQFTDESQLVQFMPGNAAFITNKGILNDAGTTSWIKFPTGSLYFSQPASSPLFSWQTAEKKEPVLQLHPLALSEMDELSEPVPIFPYCDSIKNEPVLRFHPLALSKMDELSGPVPIFPYCDSMLNSPRFIQFDNFETALLEKRSKTLAASQQQDSSNNASNSEILTVSPQQQKPSTNASNLEITTVSPQQQDSSNNDSNSEILTVSPQGLLVGLSDSGPLATWKWIALGVTKKGGSMRFEGVKPTLRFQFQQANMFALYTKKSELLDNLSTVKNFELDYSGWQFKFHPDEWRKQDKHNNTATLMLVKFSKDKSIKDLLGDNAIFKESLEQCYDEQNNERPEYASFLRVMNDPMFQGSVVLNCAVSTSDENKSSRSVEMKAILDGISDADSKNLYAHHVIIHKSQIKKNGGLKASTSSISALVEFNSGKPLTYSKEDVKVNAAEYSTIKFLLRIEDNEIVEISSVSELLLSRLFNATCRKFGMEGGACLILDGRLKQENQKSLFVFQLRTEELFTLDSSMLEHVLVESVNLSYVGDVGSFELCGRLYFTGQDMCDLFSFGFEKVVTQAKEQQQEIEQQSKNQLEEGQGKEEQSEDGKPEDGQPEDSQKDQSLAFTGLKIKMLDNGKKLECNYADIILNHEPDRARKNSLANRFPVQLLKLIQHSKQENPEKIGYKNIQSGVRQSPLTASCWYGLVWRIPLGSLGDLSSGSSLDIELLTAWCAGSSTDEKASSGCWIGVKLPTALGGQGLDVQGLLKLGFQSVELICTKNEKGNLLDYSLALNQFQIKVLWASFPPGSSKIHILADEDGKKLGWYGAYVDDKKGD